jgi:hypothetical protein
MMPTAKRKFSQNVRPVRWPMMKKTTPVTVAMAATILVILAISFWSGRNQRHVGKMGDLPNSVRMPVANMMPLPEP